TEELHIESDVRKQVEDALQISEERLDLAIKGARIGLWDWNVQTGAIVFNERWANIVGYTLEELSPISINTWIDLCHPDDLEKSSKLLEEHFAGKTDYYICEARMRHKEGHWVWVIDRGKVFEWNKDRKPLRATGTHIDISENKQTEEEIRRLNNELEQRVIERTAQLESANKELDAFCYSVSHDLRAPLRHMDGFVNLLVTRCRDSLNEKGLHYVDIIASSARQMGVLIDDLLQFSRTGRMEIRQEKMDMNRAVKETLTLLKDSYTGRSIEWVIADLPDVRGDYALIRQIWANLLENAVKYTRPRQDARIEVCSYEEKGECIFFVSDNGVGFDMQYVHKLFGVFQRLHSQEEFEGTGIGLATVQRIVKRHGGRIWAEAELNQGARFYFSLPK
ncbi:MAG: PAS domain-containing protein, partial [Desulfobacula sp.]|nr:PAS domain-containing protein [Desulfobacula sp.]